jgi:hypothetical protein
MPTLFCGNLSQHEEFSPEPDLAWDAEAFTTRSQESQPVVKFGRHHCKLNCSVPVGAADSLAEVVNDAVKKLCVIWVKGMDCKPFFRVWGRDNLGFKRKSTYLVKVGVG